MRLNDLKSKAAISPVWGYKPALDLVTLIAVVSALRLSFNLGYYYRAFECTLSAGIGCPLTLLGSFLLGTTAGLVVLAIGLWLRRGAGLWLSLSALFWEIILYVQWYRATRWIIGVAEVPDFWHLPNQQQRLLPLNDATWWDILVLAVVILLLVWHIKTLGPFLRERLRNRRVRKSNLEHSDLSRDSHQKLDHVAS